MTNLYQVDGKVIPRRINGILNIPNESELARETENMYNDISRMPNKRFLTEEQTKDLLDIGDMVKSLIIHNTFQN